MAINDVARVRIVSRQFGQEHNQVLHFRATGAQPMADLATAVDSWIGTHLADVQDASITYEKLVLDSLIPFGPYFETPITAAAGTKVGDPLPPVNAAVVTWRSAVRGKSKRGRNYWGGLITTDVIDGQLDAAVLTAWQTTMDLLLAFAAGSDWELVVWSRTLAGPGPIYDPDAAEAVTTAVMRSIVTSMRTRKIGKGS